MSKVVATERGYCGGIVREPGDVFEAEGKASWFKPVKAGDATAEPFGGKGDHDGDGKPGGSLPGDQSTARRGGRKKAETVEAPTAEPFADAPEPVRVANEANDATGQTQPDWVQG